MPTDYPFKPFPGSSHLWALEQAQSLPGPLRVLDVGAGEGHVLRAVLAASGGEGCAVEPTHDGAPANGVTWRKDLEEVEGSYDLALALDVLEHVTDPAEFLSRIVARLRPGGTALVSVPNVAHWSMRAQLLAGRFEYAERGILDRTHHRFFTRASLLELIRGAGLSVESTSASVVPLELLLPEAVHDNPLWAVSRAVRRTLAGSWPTLLGFQLLVRARKPG